MIVESIYLQGIDFLDTASTSGSKAEELFIIKNPILFFMAFQYVISITAYIK